MTVRRPQKRSLRPPRHSAAAPARPSTRPSKRPTSRPSTGPSLHTTSRVARKPAALPVPQPHDVLAAVLDLSALAGVEQDEAGIVQAYVSAFEKLLPRRMFCVRLLSPQTQGATFVGATGKLRPQRRGAVELSRAALLRRGIGMQTARACGVQVVSEYSPVCLRGVTGFDAPLLEGDALIGLVSVDYERGVSEPSDDKLLLDQLTRLLSAALGNAHAHQRVLEQRVHELQDQVMQAEKLATLGQLAAGVVHELNNPLTSIAVYGEYLLKSAVARHADEGDIEKLRRVVSSAERVLKFTRDLVTYARPSSETPTQVDLTEVVELALFFCSHVLDEIGATVEKRFEDGVAPVSGVKGQLVQVLVNLITNACHAMPRAEGRLRLELRNAGDHRVSLRVEDTGRGIAAENLARIFEPFFTTKTEDRGTGLGLSIVRNIVQQHRGEIRVSSNVGRGTVFEILLVSRPDSVRPPRA